MREKLGDWTDKKPLKKGFAIFGWCTFLMGEIVLVFMIVALYLLVSLFWPLITGGACYTPTPRYRIAQAMDIAGVSSKDVFYDLGCGAGSSLVQAKKRGAKVVGVEVEPLRWLVSKLRVRGGKVLMRDMFKVSLTDATVIFIFQYPNVNERLKRKFEKELKSGTKIVSYVWEMEGWKPIKSAGNLHLYVFGESNTVNQRR